MTSDFPDRRRHRPIRRGWQWLAQICLAVLGLALLTRTAHGADASGASAELSVGGRTLHTFRAPLGDFSPEERASAARQRIARALQEDGEGWTSITPTDKGVIVQLDGKPMFTVASADARIGTGESAETLANQSSRVLQKVWQEAQERRDPKVNLVAVAKVVAATAALAFALALMTWLAQMARRAIRRQMALRLDHHPGNSLLNQFSDMVLRGAASACLIVLWLLALLAVLACVTYSLGLFALTRPASENLWHSLQDALLGGLHAGLAALPGAFVAVAIFFLARIATQLSRAAFEHIIQRQLVFGTLDTHTAAAARYLVNTAIWLFALAMAYPYLPGSQTDAFKGLTVLLGVMVSIGAAGPVAQIASGMIVVFTRALLVGEYVRLQDCEGTVVEIGLFVTRLRTGNNEEIALPNSLVISQVTRNYSRNVAHGGYVLDTSVTIGYDTAWRQVHAMLLEAAGQVTALRAVPKPFVVQTGLSDFYVEYRLVAQVGAESAIARPQVLSQLNAAIQDVFNRHGVQIMSPHYVADTDKPKTVPIDRWQPTAPPGRGAET